jgi:3-deoxy-7-phosphoheptulonate synthase
MLIFMKTGSTAEDLDRVLSVVRGLGHGAEPISIDERRAVRVAGYGEPPHPDLFERLPGVAMVMPVSRTLRHVYRREGQEDTVVRVGSRSIGGGSLTLIAGPCAVESAEQLLEVAHVVGRAGADLLRGGAYKPRTSPYDFQGLGREGLALLARARAETGLPVVTEALDEASLDLVEEIADVVQIGARNMHDYALLKRAGRSRLPVLLKRGMAATLEELLAAAEYVIDAGNPAVMLCERGIRTFSNHSRYTLDLSIVPLLKRLTHLPVLVDPSHATGSRRSVPPLARAALAAGADGLLIEVHPDPLYAWCDGPQSLSPAEFTALAASLRTLAPFIARQRETVP